MMGSESAKPDETRGTGERAARERSRRVRGIVVLLALAGGVTGMLAAIFEQNAEPGLRLLTGTLPPWLAIGSVAVLLVAVGWGSWKFFRVVDEVELRNNYVASTIGLNFYFAVYMSWFLLWRGTVLPEPGHGLLFVATALVTAIAYLWMKWRP